MKKDRPEESLVRVPLSKLLKRFSDFDVISEMEREYRTATPKLISPGIIDDNSYIRKAKVDEKELDSDFSTLKTKGILNPLLVKRKKDHFEIVIGRRRLMAAKRQSLESVPCVLLDIGEEETLVMLAADIRDSSHKNVVELSIVCNRLHSDYGYSQSDLAILLHQSRSQVTNVMRLLNLPDSVLEDVSLGRISFGHAKAMLILPEAMVIDLCERTKREGLSVRDVEKLIYEYHHELDYSANESSIRKAWGCDCEILRNRIVLSFNTPEEQQNAIDFLKKRKK